MAWPDDFADTIVDGDTVEPNHILDIRQAIGTPGTGGQSIIERLDDLEAGSANDVFIQQTQPTAPGNWTWYELNPDNSLKTIWVNHP